MNIKTITYGALKGKTDKHDLEPLTAVVGPNRGGKTTIKDAIMLALMGKHPDLPATNPGTMKLASGSQLLATAIMDTGDYIGRTWTTGKNGAIKLETVGDQELTDIVNPIALAPSVFIAMKPTERLNFLAAMADSEALNGIVEAAIGKGTGDPFTRLGTAEKALIEQRKGAKQELDRLKKALQEHIATMPMGGKFETDIELQEKQRELRSKASIALDEATEAYRAIKAKAQLQIGLEPAGEAPDQVTAADRKLLDTIEAKQEKAEQADGIRKRLQDELQQLENDGLHGATRTELEALTEGMANQDSALDEAIKLHLDLQERHGKWAPITAACRFELDAAQKELLACNEKEQQHEGAHECPVCGTHGDDFKKALAEFNARRKALALAAINIAEDKITNQAERTATLNDEIEEAKKAVSDLTAIVSATDQLRTDDKRIAKITQVRGEIAALAPELDDDEREFAKDALTRIGARDKWEATAGIERITPEQVQAHRDGIEQLEWDIAARSLEIDERQESRRLDEALDQHQVTENDMRIRESDAAEALTEVTGKLEAIKAAKTEAIEEVWQPITGIGTLLAASTFNDEVAMGANGLDIGLADKNGFRTFDVLSGAEQLVCATALSVGAADHSGLPVVLIDEMSRLDEDARHGFIGAAAALIESGRIQQVVVFDHRADGYDNAGFMVTSV
tara:strand:- start:41251 stop:43302 length:2052 start_codon:yes stop_codon:yes gene_type:complete